MGRTKHYDIGGNLVTTKQIRRAVNERRALLVTEDDCQTLFLAIYNTSNDATIAYACYEATADCGCGAQWPTLHQAFTVSHAVHRWECIPVN